MGKKLAQLLVVGGVVLALLAFSFNVSAKGPGPRPEPARLKLVQGNDDLAQILTQRLTALKLNIVSLQVTEGAPVQIDLTLKVPGNEYISSQSVYVAEVMARREVADSIQDRPAGANLHLVILNEAGAVAHISTTLLLPEALIPPPTLDDARTRRLLKQTLDLHGLTLDRLELVYSGTDRQPGKIVILHLSNKKAGVEQRNANITALVRSLWTQIEAYNARYGDSVMIARLMISERDGRMLVDYLEDYEARRDMWWALAEVNGGWYWPPEP
jgi:hypothetical protein